MPVPNKRNLKKLKVGSLVEFRYRRAGSPNFPYHRTGFISELDPNNSKAYASIKVEVPPMGRLCMADANGQVFYTYNFKNASELYDAIYYIEEF